MLVFEDSELSSVTFDRINAVPALAGFLTRLELLYSNGKIKVISKVY